MRSILDLTTEEAYKIVREHLQAELPPLDAIENEDWGRDYLMQILDAQSDEALAGLQLCRDEGEEHE